MSLLSLRTDTKATVLCQTAFIVHCTQTWHGDGDIQTVSGVTGRLRVCRTELQKATIIFALYITTPGRMIGSKAMTLLSWVLENM